MKEASFLRLPDGRRLVYDLRDGPDDRPVVVFLNGLSQTTVAWGLQVHRLKGECRTLTYDAAGQGRSDLPPEGWRPADQARDLLHLLDALGLSRVDLVGFSYGSRIALRAALADPARVRRLVLAGCAHRETALRRWIVQAWMDALADGGMERVFRVVTPMIVGEDWLARHEDRYDNMLRAFSRRNDPEGMRRLMCDSTLPGGDLAAELSHVTQPTLVLRGELDLVVPAWLNHELVALLPDARYAECPRAGHTVAIEEPDWFADRLREHLG